MDPFQMVIVIVLICTGAGIIKTYLKHKEGLSKKQSAVDMKVLLTKLEDQKRNIQVLEKRIQNLETIIVQDDYELNQKFKEL